MKTSAEAIAMVSIKEEDRVEAGEPGTEDYDTGRVISIEGAVATVAWSSGVRTPIPMAALRLVEES